MLLHYPVKVETPKMYSNITEEYYQSKIASDVQHLSFPEMKRGHVPFIRLFYSQLVYVTGNVIKRLIDANFVRL